MSLAAILGLAVIVAGALIAVAGNLLRDRLSARREDRRQAREAFYASREAWDQSQSPQLRAEVSLAVRQEQVYEARRELSKVKSLRGEVASDEFERLLVLLAMPLLDPNHQDHLDEAVALWGTVEGQMWQHFS